MPAHYFQGSGEQLILDEGRVNKFNKRFATIGAFGKVAPASVGGDKKLEFKVGHMLPLIFITRVTVHSLGPWGIHA